MFDGPAVKVCFFPPLCHDATDFFQGFLRTHIRWPDQANNAVYKFERMVQHEAFQFPVVFSAPVGASKKCPTDLNFSFPGFKSEVP